VSAAARLALAGLGLLVGIGVRGVVWRLAVEVPPRVACPSCGGASRGMFAPVVPLTGRCTRCRVRTFPPPLVPEVLGAAGFFLAGWTGGGGWRLAAVCWLVTFGLAAVLVDAAVQRLPDVLTWPCLAGAAALCCGQAAADGSPSTVVRTVLAGAAVAGFFLLLALIADAGLGDVKLAAGIAVVLGYLSWSAVLAGVAAGFALAGIGAAVAIAARGVRPSARVALGPPLLAGALFVLALAA
jgi:leader peptidase (prepilin peptidase)/N-methyltransferase